MLKQSVIGALLLAAACSPPPQGGPAGEQAMKGKTPVECKDCESTPALPVAALPASEEEWKKKLTPDEFYILRQKGTERPYTGKWLKHTGDGQYTCAGCAQPLYDSKTKYDACGWPSFWDVIPGAIATNNDGGAVEAVCSRCKGHLGHIFNDGPAPTYKRH